MAMEWNLTANIRWFERLVDHGNGVEPNGEYKLVRKAGLYQSMYYLFHELGIQSNIIVAATRHPALGIIGVAQSSQKKKSNHRLWEARLDDIKLEDVVEFVHTESKHLRRILESAHNEWFDTKDRSRPLWKLVVVHGTHVLFVYHHMIADGRSGYAFHQSFLAALNEVEATHKTMQPGVNESVIAKVPSTAPPEYALALIQTSVSMIHVIWSFLWWTVVRLVFSKNSFLFSDASFSRTYPTIDKPFAKEDRTVTKVESLRIDCEMKQKCLQVCRNHDTTLTALLQTLIQLTLAADIYPEATLGFSGVAIDLRRYLSPSPGPNAMLNASALFDGR
ncbi:alcohol acetyltransferase-domain-containing protein [Lipomyces kononenkoae]|uniref:Alcohol acetyltransferase-domain-containing protein n=1 Tax=Lipomyces kononenkoae TaxID=34357 RepID=A0ACC3T6T9_LIPKO